MPDAVSGNDGVGLPDISVEPVGRRERGHGHEKGRASKLRKLGPPRGQILVDGDSELGKRCKHGVGTVRALDFINGVDNGVPRRQRVVRCAVVGIGAFNGRFDDGPGGDKVDKRRLGPVRHGRRDDARASPERAYRRQWSRPRPAAMTFRQRFRR